MRWFISLCILYWRKEVDELWSCILVPGRILVPLFYWTIAADKVRANSHIKRVIRELEKIKVWQSLQIPKSGNILILQETRTKILILTVSNLSPNWRWHLTIFICWLFSLLSNYSNCLAYGMSEIIEKCPLLLPRAKRDTFKLLVLVEQPFHTQKYPIYNERQQIKAANCNIWGAGTSGCLALLTSTITSKADSAVYWHRVWTELVENLCCSCKGGVPSGGYVCHGSTMTSTSFILPRGW